MVPRLLPGHNVAPPLKSGGIQRRRWRGRGEKNSSTILSGNKAMGSNPAGPENDQVIARKEKDEIMKGDTRSARMNMMNALPRRSGKKTNRVLNLNSNF
mmetsp:Transcript_12966/g.14891  ORF Transcript_12966/g.14891 Transcript_12966/m.14891 type:complete len:99 (-) Transcript_12966:331-627(-)